MAEADTGAVTLREGKMTKEIIRKKEEKQNKKKKGLRITIDSHRLLIARKLTENVLHPISRVFFFLKLCKNTKKGGKPKDSFFFFLSSLSQHAF